MTDTNAVDLYYDPFDFDIDDNPYPIWKRLRDEAPLYYNEKFDFYALSRFEDVTRELPNFQTYRSGRGTTMDVRMSAAASRSAQASALKGFHATQDGGDRTADAPVLRPCT